MAITVSNNAGAGRISSVGNNYGTQGSSYSPQNASKKVIQGSSPVLQSNYNPQVAATFNQQVPTRLSGMATNVANSAAGVSQAQAAWEALLKSFSQAPAQPAAANYDVAAANARARAAAEGAQNPLYSKYLNQFLDNARLQQKQEQQKTDMINKELDQSLARTTADTATNKTRTTEDVSANMGQINTAADEFQTDSGTENAIARIEEARNLAASGQTGGLAAQQQETTQANRNTSEKRQEAQFQTKRDEQQIFKARTFEDLGKALTRKTEDTATGKKKAKFDLDVYISQYGVGKDIKSSGYNVKAFADKNEQARQQAIAESQQEYARKNFEQFVSTLTNPGQALATRQKYGGGY